MSYIHASHKWLLDKETFEWVERAGNIPKPYEVDVPPFYWTHGKETEFLAKYDNGEVFGTYRLGNRIDMNGFSVTFLDGVGLIAVSYGDTPIITISVVKRCEARGARRLEKYCTGAEFTYTCKDVTQVYNYSYMGRQDHISFAPIIGLYNESYLNIRAFCYGIAKVKFNIWYRDEDLKLQRNVFFLGTWCIIMTDDMKLETVAILGSCSSFNVHIAKVLYTESRYITKVVVLGKR